jgi:topoisomerase-4 subunit A
MVIEKYDPARVYSVIHIDGKSKNYMVKRFVFDNLAIGKQISIISEESGSKLVLISRAAQPVLKVEQVKGKEQTPETFQVDLSEIIDVKGMKAMGNRLSQHPIKSVELIAESEVEQKVKEDIEEETTEVIETALEVIEKLPEIPVEKETPVVRPKSAPEKPVESTPESVQASPKKIDFEITNPDDIDMDDKGQLGLF